MRRASWWLAPFLILVAGFTAGGSESDYYWSDFTYRLDEDRGATFGLNPLLPWSALDKSAEQRNTRLSFRALTFVRSLSPTPAPYHYLFIMLTMALAMRLLTLPLNVKNAAAALAIRALEDEITAIRQRHGPDLAQARKELSELYQVHGISRWSGLLAALADLVFIGWAFLTLRDFAPRMVLDGASFFWVADVTGFDLGVVALWLAAMFLAALLSGAGAGPERSRHKVAAGSLALGLIFAGLALHWSVPAYVFIFWMMLVGLGVVFNRVVGVVAYVFWDRAGEESSK